MDDQIPREISIIFTNTILQYSKESLRGVVLSLWVVNLTFITIYL